LFPKKAWAAPEPLTSRSSREEDKVRINSFYGSSKRFWTTLGRMNAEKSVIAAVQMPIAENYELDSMYIFEIQTECFIFQKL
jgi:uncharacterized protein YfcZ (UPF0381/DUF406 family)